MPQVRQIVTILVGIAVAWWMVGQILGLFGLFADVLTIFGFAWLLNLVLEPLVDLLAQRIPRGYAWAIGYLCVLLLIAALAAPLAAQASTLSDSLPVAVDQIVERVDQVAAWMRERRIPVPVAGVQAIERGDWAQQLGPIVLAWSLALLSIGGQTLLVIGAAAAMSVGDSSLRAIMTALLPPTWLQSVVYLYDDVRRTYTAAIRGHLTIWGLGMGLSFGSMALFNTPGMLLWLGPLAVIRLLPYLGGALGGAITVIILLLTLPWPLSLVPALLVLMGQNVMGYVVEPLLLGRALQLSPALVLFVVLAGWKIGGMTGIAFGLPAVAVVQALAERIIRQREQQSML